MITLTLDFTVTRRELSLGARDDTTGWYAKDFTETNKEMIVIPRGATSMAVKAGVYVRLDAVGLAADVFVEGDEIVHGSVYYEVKTVKPYYFGDSFWYRECDLTLLPLHGLTYATTTPTVDDARYNTKDYWETYMDNDNLQSYSWIVCYSNADYPFVRVFKTKGVAIIFAIDQPTSEPEMGHDLTPVGYRESVPTHVLTLDTQLQWLAEAELRRIVEENPLGSIRTLERKTSTVHNFGSTQLFDTEFILNYWRGTD